MDYDLLSSRISEWLRDYGLKHRLKTLVVGVSGGIDSSVTSTLAAQSGLPVYVLNMPIRQHSEQEGLSDLHSAWLLKHYPNVQTVKINLTSTFETFIEAWKLSGHEQVAEDLHSQANTRSRIRMTALYQIATACHGMVVGTGNKVEDYGIGFFTKYGDGGVDIAPIADLYKSEVYALASVMGIEKAILAATPTDGLWDDGRGDEDQIGCSYAELEKVMRKEEGEEISVSEKSQTIYRDFHERNYHKMIPIPTFKLAENGFSHNQPETYKT